MNKNSLIINSNVKLKKTSRVLVFGSTGFIGSSIIKLLKKNKHNYIGFNSKNLNLLKKNSSNKISKIINKYDIILFISANAPVKNEKMFIDNMIMMDNFIKIKNIQSIKRLIYISSDAVYSDSKKPLNEFSNTKPQNLHGLMHLSRELILRSLLNEKLTIVRPTLVYGVNDPHNGYGPNKFIRESNKNNVINLFGKGEEIRDHISISDVSSIIYKLLFCDTNGVLNLVSGHPISFLKIAKKIKRMNNNLTVINFNKRNIPMPHNGYRVFDNSNLKNFFPNLKLRNFIKNYF